MKLYRCCGREWTGRGLLNHVDSVHPHGGAESLDDLIEAGLAVLVEDGDAELDGLVDGEQAYRLTAQGERRAAEQHRPFLIPERKP